jgi:hypothetical protein
MMYLGLAVLIAIAGCAQRQPIVIDYPRPLQLQRVVCMSAADVVAACGKDGLKDDGKPFAIQLIERFDEYGRRMPTRAYVEEPAGCYDPKTQTQYLQFSDCPTHTKVHEDCHAMNFQPATCRALFPPGGKL